MRKKTKKRIMKAIWLVLSIMIILSMVAFTLVLSMV